MWSKSKLNIDTVLAGASFSISTTEHRWIVPAGKRWKLLSVMIDPDNNSTVTCKIMGTGDVSGAILINEAATTSAVYWPGDAVDNVWAIAGEMGVGDYVRLQMGAAQGGSTIVSIRYLEMSL